MPAESSSKSSTSVEPVNPSVTLPLNDWKEVLSAMEIGVSTVGFNAFEIGGRIMRQIKEQIEAKNGK